GKQIEKLSSGCSPEPGEWTTLDGKKLQVFEAKPLPAKDPKGIGGKIGEVVDIGSDGFSVVCADGRIRVLRVRPADGGKIPAADFAKSTNLQNSIRLG